MRKQKSKTFHKFVRIAFGVVLAVGVVGAVSLSSSTSVGYAVDPPQNSQIEIPAGAPKTDCNEQDLNSSNCGIIKWLQGAMNILSALVGVVVVAVIIVGGIQYSASRDDPQAIAAAKKKIINALLALVVFIFGYAFIQWLVPGGIF